MAAAPGPGAGSGSRPLRLPGSAAEVEASRKGPRVGAFFDLDGTLVAGFTALAHTQDRLRRGEVLPVDFLRMMLLAAEYRLGRREFDGLIEAAARTARGGRPRTSRSSASGSSGSPSPT